MNKFNLKGILLAATILLVFSCNEDPLNVGFNILPQGDQLSVDEIHLPLNCFTTRNIESGLINTQSSNVNNIAPLGRILDPDFGETIVQQVLSFNANSTIGFDSVLVMDEVVSCKLYLNVPKEPVYGIVNGMSVDAYELTKPLVEFLTRRTDNPMLSDNYKFQDPPASVSTSHLIVYDNDIPGIDSNNMFLVVDLSNEFGQKFADTGNVFNGFFLSPTVKNSVGAIEKINTDNSRLVLSYKLFGDQYAGGDTIINGVISILDYACYYAHNHHGYPAGNALLAAEEQEEFYIQSLDGVKGYIEIPKLDSLKNNVSNSIGINLAEIVLPLSEDHISDTVNFFCPPRLVVRLAIDDEISSTKFPERFFFASPYFNGYFDKENWEYRLNITESVHMYINEINYYFDPRFEGPLKYFVYAATEHPYIEYTYPGDPLSQDYIRPGRVILNSGLSSQKPAYLRIVYTNLD